MTIPVNLLLASAMLPGVFHSGSLHTHLKDVERVIGLAPPTVLTVKVGTLGASSTRSSRIAFLVECILAKVKRKLNGKPPFCGSALPECGS
jgi:hypothetical protein